ncbi:MAG: O-antigen ligase family protein [Patescibacteria group bacterium]|nr:O-antigen ligase family protein [Patescibacteria group bacterium]MBU0879904.1 O-antigen ligase family protein [Patescibacteria group bacterium]MBU0897759.1 O-antigen ligase family protein [Patescibacteria group bacterium]MBU1783590.1 O-antigen ligase family protein [Patescibacteria group bacterium]MBU2081738.1 O-antigen ligase family protein [Patescibacteria group bacterium]
MSQKFYLIILKLGIFLSFLSVFLVLPNLLFPFITSKQIFFNILVEILAIFWIAFIIKFSFYRPKKSLITFGLIGFFTALLISSIFGVDFNLSFWGDIERMLGWFHIFHFFIFYLIIITVFRNWNDWRNLLIVSVVVSTAVCLYGLFKINYSTIGNTAYVSGYAIFNIYFALILFFRHIFSHNKAGLVEFSYKKNNWFVGTFYLVAAFIMLLVMNVTNTRGALIGLGISFLLFFILFIFYSKSKKIKIYSLIVIVFCIILISLVFIFKQSQFIKNVPILNRVTQISSGAVTFQTRLISWKAAAKDFHNHPILGTGFGNFAITFDKYFDSKFYSWTTSETYFDRAHNNLIEITSTAGLVGLLSYLSIFVAVLYYLFQGKKQNKISKIEFILFLCLFVAYFIQNLAIFDSFVTYLSLMLALGYIYWLTNNKEEEKPDYESSFTNNELSTLFIAGLIFLFIIYQYNIRVWQMLDGTIAGQIAFGHGDIEKGITAYQEALGLNTVLDRDSRSSLLNFLSSNSGALASLSKEKAREALDFAVKQAEKNVKYNPADSIMQMQLAQILNTASMAYTDKKEKFYYFSDQALAAIDKSITASPGRATIYPIKAQIYITRGEKSKAIETLKYAISLNKDYGDIYCNLARVFLYFKDNSDNFATMDKCLNFGGVGFFGHPEILDNLLKHYLAIKDWKQVIVLYQQYAIIQPKDPQVLAELAKAYKELGDKNSAIKTAQKAAEMDPQLKDDADKFIQDLTK